MLGDWINSALKRDHVEVVCHTCDSVCERNETGRVYECECDFGATVEALAMGLPGYSWTYDGPKKAVD